MRYRFLAEVLMYQRPSVPHFPEKRCIPLLSDLGEILLKKDLIALEGRELGRLYSPRVYKL